MCPQIFPDGSPGARQAILFSGEHLNELLSARHQGRQDLGLFIGDRPWFRPDRFGESGQHLRINGIGLGQLTGRFSKVSDLAWIDDDNR